MWLWHEERLGGSFLELPLYSARISMINSFCEYNGFCDLISSWISRILFQLNRDRPVVSNSERQRFFIAALSSRISVQGLIHPSVGCRLVASGGSSFRSAHSIEGISSSFELEIWLRPHAVIDPSKSAFWSSERSPILVM